MTVQKELSLNEQNITEEIQLTVTGMRRWCELEGIKSYTYSNDKQDFTYELGPVRFYGEFSAVHVSLAPATISFVGGNSKISFDNVKKIVVTNHDDGTAVFRVYCRHYIIPEEDIPFVVVGRR